MARSLPRTANHYPTSYLCPSVPVSHSFTCTPLAAKPCLCLAKVFRTFLPRFGLEARPEHKRRCVMGHRVRRNAFYCIDFTQARRRTSDASEWQDSIRKSNGEIPSDNNKKNDGDESAIPRLGMIRVCGNLGIDCRHS